MAAILGAVALFGAAVGAIAFVALDDRSGSDEPDERRDVLIGEGADDDEPLDPAASPAEQAAALDETVEELKAFVERERGLEFLEDVDLTVLEDAEYVERLREDLVEDLEDDEEDLRNAAGFYQALGLWPRDTDVVDVLLDVFSAGTLGSTHPRTAR